MDKFKPQSPDPYMKKPADMTLARFGHLNSLEKRVAALESNIADPTTVASYQAFYNLITNGNLVPGEFYRVPYQSVNFLNGTAAYNAELPVSGSMDVTDLHIGSTEMLIVQAIAPNRIAKDSYSESYPTDVIEYNPFANGLGQALNVFDGVVLPNAAIAQFELQWDAVNNVAYFTVPSEFPITFGGYLYLYAEFDGGTKYFDSWYEPIAPGTNTVHADWGGGASFPTIVPPAPTLNISVDGTRVELIGIDEAFFNDYDAGTLNVEYINKEFDMYGCILRRTDLARNISIPLDWRNFKFRRFQYDLSAFSSVGNSFYSIAKQLIALDFTGAITDSFQDFNVFDVYNIFMPDHQNIYIEGSGPMLHRNMYQRVDQLIFTGNAVNVYISAYEVSNIFFTGPTDDVTIISKYLHDNVLGALTQVSIRGSVVDNTFGGQFVNFQNGVTNTGANSISNTDFNGAVQLCKFTDVYGCIFNAGISLLEGRIQYVNAHVDVSGYVFPIGSIVSDADYTKEIIMGSDANSYLRFFDGLAQQHVTPITT